ncbi:MAG: hypothetical protein IBX56_19745 [Methylomicrobium sp.]|nr:hypothetical protein [Methylomicrobium sp.]
MIRTRKTIEASRRCAFITDLELLSLLSQFSSMTQKAILFSLSSRVEPSKISSLTWAEVRSLRLSKISVRILHSTPVHIHSSLIFWQQVNGEVHPIHDLEKSFNIISGDKSWQVFQEMFDRMICVEESHAAFSAALFRQIMIG